MARDGWPGNWSCWLVGIGRIAGWSCWLASWPVGGLELLAFLLVLLSLSYRYRL
nr:hypothetical protein Q903MT_gene1821 [Picea sitchensis]